MREEPSASDECLARGGRRFETTRWSLVALAGGDASEADTALNELCRVYWMPIYAEIRRRGHAPADAQDLTQEFFARLLRRNAFGRAEKEKGRFRSYLLAALDYFLADDWREKMAEKRGGGAVLLPLDAEEGETWFRELPASEGTPADAFDRGWAIILMDHALSALRAEYEGSERGEIFAAARPFLAAETSAAALEAPCSKLGMTPDAFTVAVHRLRKRFRDRVREQVAMTVADPPETDAEMRHLFGV
ncbi:MAG: sigma-70 family RNA polymerase sigma factor [Chthoniobacteraceae bacterium]